MALNVNRPYPCCEPITFHPQPSLNATSIVNGSVRAYDHEMLGITGNILLLTVVRMEVREFFGKRMQRMVLSTNKGQVAALVRSHMNGSIPCLQYNKQQKRYQLPDYDYK